MNNPKQRLDELKSLYLSRLTFLRLFVEDVMFDEYNLDLLQAEVRRLDRYNDLFEKILEDLEIENNS